MNRLTGMRAYLAGAMEQEPDNGIQWRERIGHWLDETHGVIVMDPTDKPIDMGREDIENKEHRKQLRDDHDWDQIALEMREIRVVDLRMVDISDFLVIHLDRNVPTCGTWEEIFWANRCKKPILVHYEQGKEFAPDWLFGTINHRMIFGDWHDLYDHIERVAIGKLDPEIDKRWMFFHDLVHVKCPL